MSSDGEEAVGGLSAASATAWFLALLDVVGSGPVGHRRSRQCPAHRDSSPSLSIRESPAGAMLLRCHAGCTVDTVLGALAMSKAHLFRISPHSPDAHAALFRLEPVFPPLNLISHRSVGSGASGGTVRRGMRLAAIHDYGGFQLLRYRHRVTRDKGMSWERRDERGMWIPGLGGTPTAALPLYQEDQVRLGVAAGETIIVVESESSVDALNRAGAYATTWAGGADQPNVVRLTAMLASASVLVVPDHDRPGQLCGGVLVEALTEAHADVSLVLPEHDGDDARDLLGQRGLAAFPGAWHGPVDQMR